MKLRLNIPVTGLRGACCRPVKAQVKVYDTLVSVIYIQLN